MPSHANVKDIITQDNKITNYDINLAERVFRKSNREMKSKTVRRNITLQQHDIIEIPEELIKKKLELSIDTMYINGMQFQTSNSPKLYYRTAQYLPSKKKNNYITCMKEILNIYQFGEYNVKSIHCDQKFKFIQQNFANENNITLFCEPSQANVPGVERNIRTIKETVQS